MELLHGLTLLAAESAPTRRAIRDTADAREALVSEKTKRKRELSMLEHPEKFKDKGKGDGKDEGKVGKAKNWVAAVGPREKEAGAGGGASTSAAAAAAESGASGDEKADGDQGGNSVCGVPASRNGEGPAQVRSLCAACLL